MTKTEYAKYLQSVHWKAKRLEALEGAGFRCQRCELPRWLAEIAYDQDLHVHHITYENLGDEQEDDLEVLCRRCHDLETFGRSELRKVKDSTCEMCGDKHWDSRAALCPVCLEVTSSGPLPFFFRLNHIDPSLQAPLWHRLLREMMYGVPGETTNAVLENIARELLRLRDEATVSFQKAINDPTEIPF